MKIIFGFFLVLFLTGCRQGPGNHLIVEYEKFFDSVPSASGIAIKKNTAYIVCDDGTGIYKIELKNFQQTKIAIEGLPFNEYRQDKSIKHDFESACWVTWQGKEYLTAIGSGSGGAARDSMLMINIGNNTDQKMYPMDKFYKQLQSVTNTESTQLNIEGATIAGDSIIILNRGNNLLITCSADSFFSFLVNQGEPFPQVKYRKIQLPFIGQHEARFSGICTVDETHLLFCASVEDTPDWTKDGPVLGSYFGLYSLKDAKVVETFLFDDKNRKAAKEKIESVDILQKTNDGLVFLATGDNDNGTSKLFRIRLHDLRLK
jgi:hypothetical protein